MNFLLYQSEREYHAALRGGYEAGWDTPWEPYEDEDTETQEVEASPRNAGGRPRHDFRGILIGNVDAEVLWERYYARVRSWCKTTYQRRTTWGHFCQWYRENGETLDDGTLSRYAACIPPRCAAHRLSIVRGVLRGDRKERKTPTPERAPKRKRAHLAGFKRRFLADLFRLEHGFTTDDLRKGYRKLAARLHPDHGGDADQFRALHDAYTWLCQPMHADVYRLCIWISHDRHAEIDRVSRDVYDRIGGYEAIDELWEGF